MAWRCQKCSQVWQDNDGTTVTIKSSDAYLRVAEKSYLCPHCGTEKIVQYLEEIPSKRHNKSKRKVS